MFKKWIKLLGISLVILGAMGLMVPVVAASQSSLTTLDITKDLSEYITDPPPDTNDSTPDGGGTTPPPYEEPPQPPPHV
ncbi:hypothetical protein JXM67_00035 [candidate division WOR-3 bacterium]|nr:hypothetical protein [candidate division WOR-3 bacterium]